MPTADEVIAEFRVRMDRYESDLARSRREFDKTMGSIERSSNHTSALVSRAMGGIAGALAGVSAIALAKTFLDMADASKALESQLRLATNGFGSFTQAQTDVRRVAADTRSGLEETASLYGNFARGAKELGASQGEAARATETFSKTLKISGADANSAASATLQFGQALASGALRGDELNSVLEASPRLARLLTESMGKPIGEIKALGEAGALTADKLLNALTNKKFTAGIDAEFRQMPVTFEQAMVQVENAAIITFGAFDRGGQFSTALANFITQGTDGFSDLEQGAFELGISIRSSLEGLANVFDPLLQGAKSAFSQIANEASIAAGLLNKLLAKRAGVNPEGVGFGASGLAYNIDLATGLAMRGTGIGGTNFLGSYQKEQKKVETRLRGEQGERAINDLVSPYLDRFGNPTQRARAARPVAAKPAANKKAGTGNGEAAARKAEQERLKAIRDDASQVRESARLQDDINAARAALATAAEDVLRYQIDAIESERQQQVNDIETQVKLGELGREEADRRILVNSELASLRGDLVKRRAAEAVATREAARDGDAADTLRVEADLISSRQERRNVELRILDYAYKEEEAAIRRAAAAGDIADLDEALANMRRRRVAQTEGINRQNESPLAAYNRGLQETNTSDQIETYVVDELNAVQDGIASALGKAIGTKDPLITGLLNLFIQQVIMKPLADALAGAAGGASGSSGIFSAIASGLGSLFGGGTPGRAIGGPVTAGRPYQVGENGRELFVPQQAGVIVPNHALKGGGGTTVVHAPQFNLRGAVVTAELYADMQRISDQSATRAGQTAYSQSLRDAPGAVRRAQRFRTT